MKHETTNFTLNSPSLSPDDERLIEIRKQLYRSICEKMSVPTTMVKPPTFLHTEPRCLSKLRLL